MDTIHDALQKVKNQKELAVICGVTQVAISKWARGINVPSPGAVMSILDALELDLRWMHPRVFRDINGMAFPSPSPTLATPVLEQHEKEFPEEKKRRTNVDGSGSTGETGRRLAKHDRRSGT